MIIIIIIIIIIIMASGIAQLVVTRKRAGRLSNRGSIRDRKRFFFSPKVSTGSRAHAAY
jgi:hypothetical protein